MNKLNLITLSAFIAASSAIAATGQQSLGSFDEFKLACQHPAKFHNQVAPSNIQVACRDDQRKWVRTESTAHNLETSRNVTIQVNSDKYNSEDETYPIPMDLQSVGCPAYKEVRQVIETVRSATCEELLSFQGSASDFCLAAIATLPLEDANVEDTGRTFNMCPAPEAGNPRKVEIIQKVEVDVDVEVEKVKKSDKHKGLLNRIIHGKQG